jgi:carbohydrate diacid regulator
MEELELEYVIGIGSIAHQLKDVARSFKEAQVAVDIGRVFDEDMRVMNFENLGIGRLIYQLPENLCRLFLHEVFTKQQPETFDEETLSTINMFFGNSLNVSETARQLFVHRNTLVYRLEKLSKSTGLDIRSFDDAVTFKIALMVENYLKYMETHRS